MLRHLFLALLLVCPSAAGAATLKVLPLPRPDPMPFMGPGQVGRYTVVRVIDGKKAEGRPSLTIILLDTATGSLYKASESDFKKYSELLHKMGLQALPERPPIIQALPERPPIIGPPRLKDGPVGPKVRPSELPKKDSVKKHKIVSVKDIDPIILQQAFDAIAGRTSMAFTGPVQVGRYIVVKTEGSGSDIKIILLDAATGNLYQASEKDLKKYSELGKMGGPPRPPGIGVPPLKDGPVGPKVRPLPLKEGPGEKFKDKFKDK